MVVTYLVHAVMLGSQPLANAKPSERPGDFYPKRSVNWKF